MNITQNNKERVRNEVTKFLLRAKEAATMGFSRVENYNVGIAQGYLYAALDHRLIDSVTFDALNTLITNAINGVPIQIISNSSLDKLATV